MNNFFIYDCICSTNNEAKKIIYKYKIYKGIIISDKQTQGKGKYGTKWISKKGNLYMTLFFKVKNYNRIIKLQFDTLKIIKSILLKKIKSKNKISIKYPNDILVNNKKLCGILIESIKLNKMIFGLVGIGINISNSPSVSKYQTTSLNKINRKINDRIEIAQSITKRFRIL